MRTEKVFPFVKSDGVGAGSVGGNFQIDEAFPNGQRIERSHKLVPNPLISVSGFYVQLLNLANSTRVVQQVLNVATNKPNDYARPLRNEVINHRIS